jgi:MFS family permease
MVTMWFLRYIGNYGFLRDAATLLSGHGLGIGSSILYLAAGAIGYPAGAGIMIVAADKIERKHLIFGATVGWLIGMLLIGTLANGAVVTAGSFLASLALGPASRWPAPSPPRTSRPACAPAASPWLTEAGTWAGQWAPCCCPH